MKTGSFGESEVWFRLELVPRVLANQTSNPPSAKMNPSDCFGVPSSQETLSCPTQTIDSGMHGTQ
jgi:hypothetical protein